MPSRADLPAYNATITRGTGGIAQGTVDAQGRILRCSGVTCIWEGLPQFDTWFRARYPDAEVVRDHGLGFFRALVARKRGAA